MHQLELAPAVQQWFNVVLIWIGFGTVAGLLAKTLMPARHPSGAVSIVVLGIIGSTIGPAALCFLLRSRLQNPLGPLGLAASVVGALLMMIAYRLLIGRRES